jgi:hypothetical protein
MDIFNLLSGDGGPALGDHQILQSNNQFFPQNLPPWQMSQILGPPAQALLASNPAASRKIQKAMED